MSRFKFGTVFGNGGVYRGCQELRCPCGNSTDWLRMVSDATKTEAMCGECGRTVTLRNDR
ncbi:hypothetical protein [Micromonospora sp. NBRC 107095]|uniref:hypothetical protein n=1 Tax=Micromonospora sp. NBRC 107095 TaxID=3032209 RepID=UPI0024A4A56A|nr:hypothetical protein [Micromonospora sp. NBRC 107095]GLZ62894.1 hypothetical protein Misp05_64700 [Micromonospora sp. NBRC 107095]